ncbi:MAG: hypothetical protein IT368_06370 [Candidatus Hydrogenedentes bacterium]|nr:hypothetical protein [Candidatus Hydrogenedentota bacterium]
MKHHLHQNGGFTLLELTVSLFVVTAGVFGAIQLYLHTLDGSRALDEYAIAHRILSAEMETLRALPSADLAEGHGMAFFDPSPEIDKLMHAAPAIDVTAVPEVPGLFEVHVHISWTGQHGRRIEKALVSYIAGDAPRLASAHANLDGSPL